MKGVDEKYIFDLSKAVGERLKKYGVNAEAVNNFLQNEGLRDEISYLRRHNMPDRFLYRVVSAGIREALEASQASGTPHIPNVVNPKLVTLTIYDQLRKNETYRHFADELIEEGIIDGRDAERFRRTIDAKLKKHKEETTKAVGSLERMLREAAVYVPFAISIGFLLVSVVNATYTGAIIGGGEIDINVLFGIAFLLLGLAIHHFYSNKEEDILIESN